MWLNNKPVPHVLNKATMFQKEIFIKGQSTEEIWHSFFKVWTSGYIGFPEIIILDT